MAETSEIKTDATPVTPVQYHVTLFRQDTEGCWEVQGTGFCVYAEGHEQEADQLVVRAEQQQELLLSSKVDFFKLYEQHDDKMIAWYEDASQKLALGFQGPEDCEEIWKKIQDKLHGGQARTLDYVPSEGERELSPQYVKRRITSTEHGLVT